MRHLFLMILWLAGATWGALWLASQTGSVTIIWQGYQLDIALGLLAVLILILTGLLTVLGRLTSYLVRAPKLIRSQHRSLRGRQALEKGFFALATANFKYAQHDARRAHALLPSDPLALLLAAESARLNGDTQAAKTHYQALSQQPQTALIGLRGRLLDALACGDYQEALQVAHMASQHNRPVAPWAWEMWFDLASRQKLWLEALEALQGIEKLRLWSTTKTRRLRGLVLWLKAEQDHPKERLRALARARRFIPECNPLVRAEAKAALSTSQWRWAKHTIEKAWRYDPHLDLLVLYALADAKETQPERARLSWSVANKLIRTNPHHPANALVIAEAALAEGAKDKARAACDQFDQLTESLSSLPLIEARARLEHQLSGPEAAQSWRERCASPRRQVWLCVSCGTISDDWQPACSQCSKLDSLENREVITDKQLAPICINV